MLVVGLSGLAVFACSSGDDGTPGSSDSPTSGQAEDSVSPDAGSDDPLPGVHMLSTDNFEGFPDHTEAARMADLIVIARVNSPGAPFWTTVSGERPGVTADGRLASVPPDQLRWGSSPQIFTPWTMTVEEVLKGEVPEDEPVLVSWWGGKISPDAFTINGQQTFVAGEVIVLYLKDCGPDHLAKYGSSYRFIKRLVNSPNAVVTHVWGERRSR